MMRLTPVLLLGLLAPLPRQAAEEQGVELEDILLYARAAQSVALRPTAAVAHGEVEYLGVDAKFELNFDDTSLFRLDVEGRLVRRIGNDAAGAWEEIHGAGPYDLELTLREEALLTSWVWTGQWVLPDTPIKLELLHANDAEVVFAVRVAGGLASAELTLNGETFLPSSLLLHGGETRIRFEDYGVEGGFPLARLVHAPLGPGREVTYRVQSVTSTQPRKEHLERPEAPEDYRFDRHAEATVKLHATPSGHLFVRGTVAGEDPGWFLFDTGAGFSGLNAVAADQLGLGAFGSTMLSGVGGHAGPRRMRRAPLQLGSLIIHDVIFTENNKGRGLGPIDGDPVVGVLGWDVLARAVAVVDLDAGTLELHDPAKFELEEGSWEPLVVHHRVPYVTCRFEGEREGRFMIDTGAGNLGVLFFAHATRELNLLEGRETEELAGRGAGGEVPLRLGTLEWLELSGILRESPTTAFSIEDDGEADPYSLGVLGNGVLRGVRVILDYTNQRVAFVR